MIDNGIVILNIDQNYSQIIIGAVIVLAVLLDRISNVLREQRLARVALTVNEARQADTAKN
jgi:ribose/xylose/arabinose/galactoside ABC-type transport system permease subunit